MINNPKLLEQILKQLQEIPPEIIIEAVDEVDRQLEEKERRINNE